MRIITAPCSRPFFAAAALFLLIHYSPGVTRAEPLAPAPGTTSCALASPNPSFTPHGRDELVPGDPDADGDFDLDDLGIWATNFTGTLPPGTGPGTHRTGDLDGDKDVDLDDQGIWASHFTGSLAPSGIATGPLAIIPEPASLAACGLALLARRRRRA
jgi:hypothetical protein